MKHVMRIADRTGDTVVEWEVDNKAQVQAAQEQFEALVKQGHQAYAFKVAGQDGEVATAFDPQAAEIIVMPRAVGG